MSTEPSTSATPAALIQAREQFLALVENVRPELHRYCARLTGSVIEGEDIVQETLGKAFYAITLQPEIPHLRPWLFRIAHNTAIDALKRHDRRLTDVTDDMDSMAGFTDAPDPVVIRAALARFLTLPLTQRSAVILKDVLGHSLEETAETMGTTVMAVKAALVRGRAALRQQQTEAPAKAAAREEVDRYAMLFNARDWDGVRALLGDACKLDLVSKSQRQGKAVGMYFGNYAKLDVTVRVVELEGRWALAAFPPGAEKPAYFVLLEHQDGKIAQIRDFKYVPYIADDAQYVLVG